MLKTLIQKRAAALRAAMALQGQDGNVPEANQADFDARMAEFDALDNQVRALEAAEPAPATGAPAAPAAAPVVDQAAVRAAAVTEERARVSTITALCRTHRRDQAFTERLITEGVTVEAARTQILEALTETDRATETRSGHSVVPGQDAHDKFARGVLAWLLIRSGLAAMVGRFENPQTPTAFDAGEFRGMSLLDIARECLTRNGVATRGMDKMKLVALAFQTRSNYQTPSDFTTLLENVMHKVLRASYGITPDTWSRFCATGSVSDFRTHNWYRTGALSELDGLNDAGEFKNKAIPDGEKATYAVTTKGNIIGISRQTIVNDDMGAVLQLTQRLGRAGKLTIEKMVYALLAQNAGLGPTYGGVSLFHATRNNLGTGAALSAASVDADRVVMGQQTDVNSNEYTDLRPAVLLLPLSLGGQARVINQSQYDPDTVANKAQMKPNIVAGLYRDIIDTPRLTGTRRYSFADPSIAPVFMVSFLEGQQEPVLETQDGWRTDGVEMKARLDVGVDAVDYRGAVTNAGA